MCCGSCPVEVELSAAKAITLAGGYCENAISG